MSEQTPGTETPATPAPPTPSASAAPSAPAPAPAAAAAPTPAPPPSAAASAEAAQWGRVDDAGNVFVRTADGERQVGSWQAGSPGEALAFYTRKYENLRVEIDLLGRRIRGEGGATIEPDEATASIERLRTTVAEANVVGDLAALSASLDGLVGALDARRGAIAAEKAKAKAEAKEKREAVVVEAESLAESTSWKATGERYRELLEEWKAAPRIDR